GRHRDRARFKGADLDLMRDGPGEEGRAGPQQPQPRARALQLGGQAVVAAGLLAPGRAVAVAVGGPGEGHRRRAPEVDQGPGGPLARPPGARLGLAPDGGELAPGLEVLAGALLLLADVLLAQRDHLLDLLRLEGLAIRLVVGVVEAGPVGLEVDLAL